MNVPMLTLTRPGAVSSWIGTAVALRFCSVFCANLRLSIGAKKKGVKIVPKVLRSHVLWSLGSKTMLHTKGLLGHFEP